MIKYLFTLIIALGLLVFTTQPALAEPFNAADKNPNVVAYYTSGDHGIVGEQETHTGTDLVMLAGKSGNLQQWFYGNSTENGGITEGDHSVWHNVGDQTSCPANQVLVPNAYPAWGDYLEPGANYCVNTNDFRAPGH